MGKTRPPSKVALSKRSKKLLAQKQKKAQISAEELLAQAAALLQIGEPDNALPLAQNALSVLISQHGTQAAGLLPALGLLGEVNLEMGAVEAARGYFLQAALIDDEGEISEGLGGGAEKFMWLAQLSEEGGEDSVKWFRKGADVLRRQVERLESMETDNLDGEERDARLKDTKARLASALCGIAEVYMTDLSFDDEDAETQCNAVMEEALQLSPDNPETLQTLASVRISQHKPDEARRHLLKSLALWRDLEPEDERIPAFPTRISLARLLMDAELEDQAMDVIERLISEDDTSVEAWYLGGWCLYITAEKRKSQANGHTSQPDMTEDTTETLKRSRTWLTRCLKLFMTLEYEDEQLKEHAEELVAGLNAVLGEPIEGEEEEDDDGWEDEDDGEDDSGDEEMEDT